MPFAVTFLAAHEQFCRQLSGRNVQAASINLAFVYNYHLEPRLGTPLRTPNGGIQTAFASLGYADGSGHSGVRTGCAVNTHVERLRTGKNLAT